MLRSSPNLMNYELEIDSTSMLCSNTQVQGPILQNGLKPET